MAIINDFLSLIYPRSCEACTGPVMKHEKFLCTSCIIRLPRSGYHKHPDNEMHRLLAGRVPLRHALSFFLFEKSGNVQRMLHHIKYEKQKELAVFIGSLYAQELLKDGCGLSADVILPVPLHPEKEKQRGFNQSEYFARGLAQGLGIELRTDILQRTAASATQTRKRKFERWENVEGIFSAHAAAALRGRHVLIADDVITTGATIEAVWLALRETEQIQISAASIAFAAQSFR